MIHTHLHTHYSNYGMLDSISKVPDVIKRVKELNQSACAITDHNTCSGLIDFYKNAKKNGIKPLLGAELYLTGNVGVQEKGLSHILFLAKNQTGYKNLLHMTTEAHKHFYYKSRLDIDIIKKYSEELICTSACIGGWLKNEDNEFLIKEFLEIFKENLYLEVHTYQIEEQKQYNIRIAEYGKKYGIPIIATCDSHYVTKEEFEIHKHFRSISSEEDTYYATNDFYIQSADEVKERLSYLPLVDEYINNTDLLGEQCNVDIEFGKKLYPSFPVEDTDKYLREQMKPGYREKILNNPERYKDKKIYDAQILHELDVLKQCGYYDYFLINWDWIKFAKENDISVGAGRGSVGASMVAWLLDIVKRDPLPNKLFFERFAHTHRIAPPDIDSDVSQRGRKEVIDYISSRFGSVHQVRTFSYMKAKGSLARAGQALNISPDEIKQLSKKITFDKNDEEDDISDIDIQIAMLDSIATKQNEQIINLAKKFLGIIQGQSKHASAVIVTDIDISDYTSIERQVDTKTKQETFIVSTDFHFMEDLGFMKLDVLGLRTLDVIEDTLLVIPDDIDIFSLPLQDPPTIQLLQEGHTLGVFQFASQSVRGILKKIKPTHFNDLMHITALYRPGCIVSGMLQDYLDRRTGKKQVAYKDDRLKEILDETLGTICYQEQVIEIVKVLGGYTLGEADVVRRGMGKKDKDELDKVLLPLVDKCIQNGVDPDYAKELVEQLKVFSGYAFNKAHSQNYSYTAYITAYLKANYPVQFMCALLNSKISDQEKSLEYIYEAKRMGLKILPPSLRESKWIITDDGDKQGLQIGYSYIKNVSKELLDIESFEMGVGSTEDDKIDHFFRVTNKRVVESLIKAGCFGENYNQLLADLEWLKIKTKKKPDRPTGITTTQEEIKKYQIEVLGFSFLEKGTAYNPDSTLAQYVIGVVMEFKPRLDKNKKRMAFVKVRTANGILDRCVIFWKNYKELVEGKEYQFSIKNNIIEDVR